MKVDIARIRVGGSAELIDQKDGQGGQKTSFTAGQVLMQQDGKKSRDSLQGVLSDSELNVVNSMFKSDEAGGIIEEINSKFEDLYRRIEEVKVGKIMNDYGERDL